MATGFIAKNPAGQVTTLKRNGSDYSATIMGALVRGSAITIWTDVDGVFSADPRKVGAPSLVGVERVKVLLERGETQAPKISPRPDGMSRMGRTVRRERGNWERTVFFQRHGSEQSSVLPLS